MAKSNKPILECYETDIDYILPVIISRGYVLTKAIFVEEFMDKVIAEFFLGNRNEKESGFKTDILSNINARPKFETFKSIISSLPLDESEKLNLKGFYNDIQFIIAQRNNLAHNQAFFILSDDSVGFMNKRKSRFENIGNEELDLIYEKYKNIKDVFTKIYIKYFFQHPV
jgi:hypothetical protein